MRAGELNNWFLVCLWAFYEVRFHPNFYGGEGMRWLRGEQDGVAASGSLETVHNPPTVLYPGVHPILLPIILQAK